MRHHLAVFVHEDTERHMEWLREKLEKKRGAKTTMSDVVTYLVRGHWVKTQKKQLAKLDPTG